MPGAGLKLITVVVIGIDCTCTGSCKSNYHTIITLPPHKIKNVFADLAQDKKISYERERERERKRERERERERERRLSFDKGK